MSILLESKFFRPRPRQEIVERPRLFEQLDSGLQCKLILVLAQAGFGKTTLVSGWLNSLAGARPPQIAAPRMAWLSLDENDNDPLRFFDYLIAALQRAAPNIGAQARHLLSMPEPPSDLEILVASLINDLTTLSGHLILALDDYHTITAQAVHQAIHYFISHAPDHFHLILISRVEPPLPLTRWRMYRELVEIRENDLRFSLDETMTYLLETMRCTITRADVAALEQRTEGWIVGLHLAALSLQRHSDAAAFIADFTGSHAYIVDYLTEEVLQRQPPEIQEFLFHTALLSRFCGPLCDAVMERTGSQQILEHLERSHLFIIALDSERGWYRFHHLFAEMLRRRSQEYARQQGRQPRAAMLRRATQWHLDHGLEMEAVEYALAGEDDGFAAALIERSLAALMTRGHFVTLLQWLDRLPTATLCTRPLLCAARTRVALRQHDLDEAERWLDITWQALAANPDPDPEATSEAHTLRVDLLLNRGRLAEAIRLAQEALTIVPAQLERPRGEILLFLSIAYFWEAQYEEATAITLQSAQVATRAGDILTALYAWANYARFSKMQGKLHASMAAHERTWAFAAEHHVEQMPLMGSFHVNQAEIYYEWNMLDAAEKELNRARQLAEQARNPRTLARANSMLIMVYHARGHTAEAGASVQLVQRIIGQYQLPANIIDECHRPIIRYWLDTGNLSAVAHWLDARNLPMPDAQSNAGSLRGLAREYYLVARYLAAQNDLPAAAGILAAIIDLAQRAGQITACIDIQAYYALVLQQMGDSRGALAMLARALEWAEAQSFMRTFIDEGKAMHDLLVTVQPRLSPTLQHYVGALLQAFGHPTQGQATHYPVAPAQSSAVPQSAEPLARLSERELEVLQLVDAGLSDSQIAAKLILAIGTVKRHLNNIYGKLGVHNRTHALARARMLGLL